MSKRQGRTACVILAAGMSVRYGKIKQLSQFQGKPLLQRAIDTANESEADYVLLVVGAYASKILAKILTGRAQVVYNNNFNEGQSTSIKCGILNLPKDCTAAILMVADQPFLRSEHLDKMIQIFKSRGAKLIALSQGKKPRNPVLVGRDLFPRLMKLEGDVGARDIVRNSNTLMLLPIDDPRAFLDVDTHKNLK